MTPERQREKIRAQAIEKYGGPAPQIVVDLFGASNYVTPPDRQWWIDECAQLALRHLPADAPYVVFTRPPDNL